MDRRSAGRRIVPCLQRLSQDATETLCQSQCAIRSSLIYKGKWTFCFLSKRAVFVFRDPQINTAFPDTCRGTLLKNDAGVIAFNAGIGACAEGCRQLQPEKRRKVRRPTCGICICWSGHSPHVFREQPSCHHAQICQTSLQALRL